MTTLKAIATVLRDALRWRYGIRAVLLNPTEWADRPGVLRHAADVTGPKTWANPSGV